MELAAYDQARDQTSEPSQESPQKPPREPNSNWQAADLRIRRWYQQREEILTQMQQAQLLLSPSAAINAASIGSAMISPASIGASLIEPSFAELSLSEPSLMTLSASGAYPSAATSVSASSSEVSSLTQALGHLCQQLIDYVSMGHFVIYVQLIKPSRLRCANTLFQLYRTIGTTTDSVLAFNTLFDKRQWLHPAAELDRQLAWLDSQLHTRFALEDTLLNLMEACSSSAADRFRLATEVTPAPPVSDDGSGQPRKDSNSDK